MTKFLEKGGGAEARRNVSCRSQECRRKKENEESRSRRIRGGAGKLSGCSNSEFRVKEGE